MHDPGEIKRSMHDPGEIKRSMHDPGARLTGRPDRVSGHAAVFPARMDAFPRVAAFVEAVCAAAGFERDACLRLTLVLEELFTNTVVHGHGGDSEAPIALTFDVKRGEVAVVYEDTGPRFDPFADVEPPRETAPVEGRRVGGLGLLLVTRMAAEVRYWHAEGRNHIALVMHASRSTS